MMQVGEQENEREMTKAELHSIIACLYKMGFSEKQIITFLFEITK